MLSFQLECVSGGVAPSSLSRHQVDNVKEVLQGDSLIITNLVKTLNHAKKDIALWGAGGGGELRTLEIKYK